VRDPLLIPIKITHPKARDRESKPRPETSKLIKERGIALCPELLPPDKRQAMRIEDLDVVEEAVGLRPTRTGGIRIELAEMGECSVLSLLPEGTTHRAHFGRQLWRDEG